MKKINSKQFKNIINKYIIDKEKELGVEPFISIEAISSIMSDLIYCVNKVNNREISLEDWNIYLTEYKDNILKRIEYE